MTFPSIPSPKNRTGSMEGSPSSPALLFSPATLYGSKVSAVAERALSSPVQFKEEGQSQSKRSTLSSLVYRDSGKGKALIAALGLNGDRPVRDSSSFLPPSEEKIFALHLKQAVQERENEKILLIVQELFERSKGDEISDLDSIIQQILYAIASDEWYVLLSDTKEMLSALLHRYVDLASIRESSSTEEALLALETDLLGLLSDLISELDEESLDQISIRFSFEASQEALLLFPAVSPYVRPLLEIVSKGEPIRMEERLPFIANLISANEAERSVSWYEDLLLLRVLQSDLLLFEELFFMLEPLLTSGDHWCYLYGVVETLLHIVQGSPFPTVQKIAFAHLVGYLAFSGLNPVASCRVRAAALEALYSLSSSPEFGGRILEELLQRRDRESEPHLKRRVEALIKELSLR